MKFLVTISISKKQLAAMKQEKGEELLKLTGKETKKQLIKKLVVHRVQGCYGIKVKKVVRN